jgi:hypothetical protein
MLVTPTVSPTVAGLVLFHTFVHAGPIFTEPIACELGEVVSRDGFKFCDVRLAD